MSECQHLRGRFPLDPTKPGHCEDCGQEIMYPNQATKPAPKPFEFKTPDPNWKPNEPIKVNGYSYVPWMDLMQTQIMLETIVRTKSTDFQEVQRQIISNRRVLNV